MPCADREGETGVHTRPPKNHKAVGFLSNTGPDPLKNRTTTKLALHSMLGDHWPASEKPFQCRCAGGPMMARY